MSVRPLTAREKEVKLGLLAGHSINSLTRKLGIKKSSLYSIVDKLIATGEIKELFYKKDDILRPYNPRMFVDPKDSEAVVPIGTTEAVPETIDGFNQTIDTSGNRIPTVNMRGISVAKVCPEGYVEAHINGQIYIEVEETGEFDRLQDSKGLTCGYFSKEVKSLGKGGMQKKGELRLFNQDITICYRWYENTDSRILVIYPSRLYLDPMFFENKNEVKELFMERAEFIAYVMERNGWRIKKPRLTGSIHFPFTTPGLAQHYDLEHYPEGSDLIVDGSKGDPEVEMVNSDDPLFMEKAKIMAQLPTEIMQLKASDGKLTKTYQELKQENAMFREILSEISSNLFGVEEVLNQLLQIETKQLKLNTDIIKIQSNENGLKLANNQQSLDDFFKKIEQNKHSPKLDDFIPEGYQ